MSGHNVEYLVGWPRYIIWKDVVSKDAHPALKHWYAQTHKINTSIHVYMHNTNTINSKLL